MPPTSKPRAKTLSPTTSTPVKARPPPFPFGVKAIAELAVVLAAVELPSVVLEDVSAELVVSVVDGGAEDEVSLEDEVSVVDELPVVGAEEVGGQVVFVLVGDA
jgi:uncharacterized protein YlxW (UPF0749 family)